MAVLIPGIPGRPGMTNIMRDWWQKSITNVLYEAKMHKIRFRLGAPPRKTLVRGMDNR